MPAAVVGGDGIVVSVGVVEVVVNANICKVMLDAFGSEAMNNSLPLPKAEEPNKILPECKSDF